MVFLRSNVAAAWALLAALPVAGQVVDFNVTPLTSSGGTYTSVGNVNLAMASYDSSGLEPGFSFSSGTDMFFGASVWIAGTNTLNVAVDGSGFIARLSASDIVDGSWTNWTSGFSNPPLFSGGSGPWVGGGTGYVGLRIASGVDYYYGLATFNYNVGGVALTFSDLAIQSTLNAGISAALAIPEPSGAGLIAGLAVVGVAMCWRRSGFKNRLGFQE
jgi:hypothetical protein